ncbi:MAG: nitroreductase family protein, partial [Candidatus Korarchaeota archaeon]|nr:nitroreductase family protein [Candidatus Korarchaeota archaeon]NIU84761.1 hypothetical protein [Candidatus Thorarchaeota archaeon]NIW14394.1 hypothetical protein [Candidatus Thorarchaeota archaeon]NIW52835.1 hypothetical protein [Candidatus Korarchaeota archaeon]
MDSIWKVFRNRRTVREFKSTPVPKDDILKILNAARYAPSAGNVQPWKFVVLTKRKRLDSLCETLQKSWKKRVEDNSSISEDKREAIIKNGQDTLRDVFKTPVYLLVFVDPSVYPEYALYDGCLAAENIMLAARALGYGTGFYTTFFPAEIIKKFVNAPEQFKFLCAIPVGEPTA